jgi:thiamine-monophosphate kinase
LRWSAVTVDNGTMTTVHDVGEFGLIDRLARIVADARLDAPTAPGFRMRLGIGDDAAAWHADDGVMVTTTDTMVEGVHFAQGTTPWRDVGWKVMAANLSDIAAMGALPLHALVTLGLPGETLLSVVEEMYYGMLEACDRYRLLLVGGDTVSAFNLFISVTVTGRCTSGPLTRSAARPGDAIGVTGSMGGSAGGLRLLQSPDSDTLQGSAAQVLAQAHRRPAPRLEAGQHLVRAGIRCAMDISDGLRADVAKLALASGVGARVQAAQVPVEPCLTELLPKEALQLALNGGEEYELLFTGRPEVVQRIVRELPGAALIGEVTADTPGSVVVIDEDGTELSVMRLGWDHLR